MTEVIIVYTVLTIFGGVITGLLAIVEDKPKTFPPLWVFYELAKGKMLRSPIGQLRLAILCGVLSVPLIPVLLFVRFCIFYTKFERKWAEKIGKGPN